MAKFDPPPKFSFRSNEWEEWLQDFQRFRIASKLHKEEGDVQRDSLLYCMGSRKAEQVMTSFRWGKTRVPDPNNANQEVEVDEVDTMYDILVNKFTNYFIPRRNIIHERSIFNQCVQKPNTSVEEFVRELQEKVKHCGYNDPDDQVRDRLVIGLRDPVVKEKLQLMSELSLDRAINTARRGEMVKEQMREQRGEADEVSDSRYQSRGRGYSRGVRGRGSRGGRGRGHGKSERRDTQSEPKCGRCGNQHTAKSKCPATGKTCNYCHKHGHFVSMCRKRLNREAGEVEQRSSDIEDVESRPFYIREVEAVSCPDNQEVWTTDLSIGGKRVTFKIDSGADISVMSESTYQTLPDPPTLKPTSAMLTSPGGKLQCIGEFIADIKRDGTMYSFRVVVVSHYQNNLLSRAVSNKMGLIQRMDEIQESVFGSIGLMKTAPVKIHLRENAHPHCVTTARRIPFPLMDKVRQELEQMKSAGVIEEVSEPTDWCAAVVPVVKPSGKVRLCVDLKKLNQAVKREHYMLPNLDDISPSLQGSRFFSTLDASSGFLQVPLDPSSAKLTTFITPFGRYCFNRVPFGITSAPEIFQKKMCQLLEGLEGTHVIMDDVLIHGKTEEEHDARLNQALKRIENSGLKLNRAKCQFKQSQLKYFGHVISHDGIKPHEAKVKAINELPTPTNVSELRRAVGMLNYLSKFTSGLSSILKPLTDLLTSDRAWLWTETQQRAFDNAKRAISSSNSLAYYDSSKPTRVSADASSYGIGGALFQLTEGKWTPIAFCSRTLSPAESRYAQIEKECLASVWTCEKFSRYLIGLDDFELLTDHKPLVPLIMTKDLDQAPVRCQRLLMRMMRFNPKVRHVPGKDLIVADTLSRGPASTSDENDLLDSDEVEQHVAYIQANWPVSTHRLQSIRIETAADPIMQTIMQYVLEQWPHNERDVPLQAKPYIVAKGQLSVIDGVLAYGDRIVIPPSMRESILEVLHESHQGITKCRENANNAVWWPGIGTDIRQMIERCITCRENRPTQQSEPLVATSLPGRPWEKIAADLLEIKRKHFIVIVDYYSRWIDIKPLPSTTSNAVIGRLKEVFATHGIPDELITDNGPQFVAEEFKQFSRHYKFTHNTTSPHYPQANGEAEAAVKVAKKILMQQNEDIALLNYRNTPHSATKMSPAQALFGRSLKTRLPVLAQKLIPQPHDPIVLRQNDSKAKERYKQNFDSQGVKALPPLKAGQPVLMKLDNEKRWGNPGVVVKSDHHTVQVETPTGTFRRNRRHLQQIPEMPDRAPINPPATRQQDLNPPPAPEPASEPAPEPPSTSIPQAPPSPASTPQRRTSRVSRPPRRLIEEKD
jgi:hypothetical protein